VDFIAVDCPKLATHSSDIWGAQFEQEYSGQLWRNFHSYIKVGQVSRTLSREQLELTYVLLRKIHIIFFDGGEIIKSHSSLLKWL